MKNEFGIDNKIYEEILNVFKQIKQIEKVILFGSRAANTYKDVSDIDIAIQFKEEDKTLLIIRKLDEIRCILKFDVLNIEKIQNQELLKNIKKDGIQIY